MKKIISWNVNGLRACMTKGFMDFFDKVDADIFCLQEIKLTKGQLEWDRTDYYSYWNYAEKKGYSGTAVFTKEEPVNVTYGIGIDEHDHEGRVITLEFPEFYLVTAYVPNSKRELERLEYRMRWEDDFRAYLCRLKEDKPVIMCGDLNVAHEEIDIKNPKTNHMSAGFTDDERNKFSRLLEAGFVDSYRMLYPDRVEYSWWSYMFHAREKNAGWRIDYFVVSEDSRDRIKDAVIHTTVMGSDHCPVEVDVEF